MESSDWTIKICDFRCLKHIDWSPEGVCLLASPNGFGKTTLLNAILLINRWFYAGHEHALRFTQGAYLRRLGAADSAPVIFEIRIGDISWSLALPVDARGLTASYGETLKRGDETVIHAEMFKDQWIYNGDTYSFDGRRCCAKRIWDREEPEWMKPLADRLKKSAYIFLLAESCENTRTVRRERHPSQLFGKQSMGCPAKLEEFPKKIPGPV